MKQDQHSNFAARWGNEDAEEETKSLCLPRVLTKSSFSLEKKARFAEITALRIARCESIILSVAFSQAIFVLVSGAHESGI